VLEASDPPGKMCTCGILNGLPSPKMPITGKLTLNQAR